MEKTGNELIAEFMGWENGHYAHLPNIMHKNTKPSQIRIHKDDLEYDTSWDWLMPACKQFDQLYTGKQAPVRYIDHCDKIDNAVSCYEIDWAFEALVNGIKWYNQQTVTPKES